MYYSIYSAKQRQQKVTEFRQNKLYTTEEMNDVKKILFNDNEIVQYESFPMEWTCYSYKNEPVRRCLWPKTGDEDDNNRFLTGDPMYLELFI
jgi:hypothetical protein